MDRYEELVERGEYIERDVYSSLVSWKRDSARDHIGLFLKGSRRVGKTILALALGHREYKSFILVSFLEASKETKDLFVNGLSDLDRFYEVLQATFEVDLHPGESLIILDEVQLFPQARSALKVLLEDGRYDFIETGSLAGIEKTSGGILIPSEEDELEIFPLTFKEFLQARGNARIIPLLESTLKKPAPLRSALPKIMHEFRTYMLTGGMPQSISAYLKGKGFEACDKAKRRINALYLHDENAAEGKEENCPRYVSPFYATIPNELNKHDKNYRLSHISPNARWRDYAKSVRWLSLAYCANLVYNASDPSPALPLSAEGDNFKCYLMDTGLLVSLCFADQSYADNDLYKKILTDSLHINEGMFVENIVAQCLRSNGHRLFFYERMDEYNHVDIEVDFLIRRQDKVIPIEVKSASSQSIRSLKKFKDRFGKKIGQAIVLHDGEVKEEDGILYLPYFFAAIL